MTPLNFWRLILLFVVFVVCVEALGWKSWGRKVRGKVASRFTKPRAFKMVLTEGDPTEPVNSPPRGWLSRLKGAIRRPKKTKAKPKRPTKRRHKWGIFGKDMLEPIEASGAEMQRSAAEIDEKLPISEPNSTLSDVLDHATHTTRLFMRRNEEYRSMIKVTIDGVLYKMLFDTGSPWGMIPEKGCTVVARDSWKNGRDKRVFTPPAGEDKSTLTEAEPGAYAIPADGKQPKFHGYLRKGEMILNGNIIPAEFVTADVMEYMPFPIMGASPRIVETNLAYQILEHFNPPQRRFTTFLRTPEDEGHSAPNGNVVFGTTDWNICKRKTVWMPTDSSLRLWRLTFDQITIGRKSLVYKTVLAEERTAIADTGTLHFYVQSDIYAAIIAEFNEATGYEPTEAEVESEGQKIKILTLPCDCTQFFVRIRICEPATKTALQKCHILPMRSYDFTRPLKEDNVCELMIKDAGTGPNLFGVPFYRSACIIHDYNKMRLGFTMMQPAARKIKDSTPTPPGSPAP